VEGTRRSTTTGNDGRYRIGGMAAGTYTVQARYIGYAPGSAPVAVSADQEATADLALGKSAQRLDEVVTTGTLVPTEVKALPTPITVITADDIEQQHVRRLDEMVQLAVPGSVVWEPGSYSPEVSRLSVRGTSSLDVNSANPKLYIDGIETTYYNSALIDPQSVERVEVIRGPQAAAIYGSDALGGVIQIFTKRGNGGERPQASLDASVGHIESGFPESGALLQRYTAAIQGGLGSASYRVGGGFRQTGEWLPQYKLTEPNARAALRVEQGPLIFDLSARLIQQGFATPLDPRLVATGFIPAAPSNERATTREETYGLTVEYRPRTWWQNRLTVGVDWYSLDRHQTAPRRATPDDTLLSLLTAEGRRASIHYNTVLSAPLGTGVSGSLTAGVDHYSYTTDILIASGTLSTAPLLLAPGQSLFGIRIAAKNTGLFAQTQLAWRETLFLTAAVRAESSPDFGSQLGMPLSPRAGLTLVREIRATTLKLRASYGEAIRPPQPGQAGGYADTYGTILPNALLRPERQLGPDAGIDVLFGSRASLGVTYFRQTAKDFVQLVTLDATSIPPISQYQNLARVRNDGWEFEGSLSLRRVTVRGQFAVVHSRPTELDPTLQGAFPLEQQFDYVPGHTGAMTLALTPFGTTTLTGGLAYTGSWTGTDVLAQYRCFAGTGPCTSDFQFRTRYPGFATLSAAVEQQLGRLVTGYVSVEDLTNRADARGRDNGTAVQGRITSVGVRARF